MDSLLDGQRVLWGIGTPRTMRPHWALCELAIPYETRAVRTRSPETQTSDFAALNVRRKIPVLQDGDFIITESAAIVAYLSDRYATEGNALFPAGIAERARWLEWCFYIMTELDAASLYMVRRHVGLKHIYGEAPVAVEAAKSYFSKQLVTVTERLTAGEPYLMGEKFSSADILLTTCLTNAISDEIQLPKICMDYLALTTLRPAYRAAHATNHP